MRRSAQQDRHGLIDELLEVCLLLAVSRLVRASSQASTLRERVEEKRTHASKLQKPFEEYPQRSRELALLRHKMLTEYFTVRATSKTNREAERAARALWLRESGRAIDDKTVRRWVRVVKKAGGMSNATLVTFVDGRNCEHPKARKTK